MSTTLVYISTCATDARGVSGAFLATELPWLRAHFARVLVCGYHGMAEVADPIPASLPLRGSRWQAVPAAFGALFSRDLYRELAHLARDRRLSPTRAAKLLAFAIRGRMLSRWVRPWVRDAEQTVFYSFWMSYDAYAAALLKRRFPKARAIARGHAFDIDAQRNPMNPYLMKRCIADSLDGLYLISEDAKTRLLRDTPITAERLQVLALGSTGAETAERFPAPSYIDGVFRVVSCSSVIAIKQLPLLIDALSLWSRGRLRWTHIGGGADEAAVRAYAAQKLGARPEIDFQLTGAVDHARVEALYAAQPFDVFVNTSRSEGVPVSIMEAMRAGIPIVAPNLGGIPELVDSQIGVLYAPGGGAQAVLAALLAIADLPPQKAEFMRAAAQARWNRQCRSDALLERLFPQV